MDENYLIGDPLPPCLELGSKMSMQESSEFMPKGIPCLSRDTLYNEFTKIDKGKGVFVCCVARKYPRVLS